MASFPTVDDEFSQRSRGRKFGRFTSFITFVALPGIESTLGRFGIGGDPEGSISLSGNSGVANGRDQIRMASTVAAKEAENIAEELQKWNMFSANGLRQPIGLDRKQCGMRQILAFGHTPSIMHPSIRWGWSREKVIRIDGVLGEGTRLVGN